MSSMLSFEQKSGVLPANANPLSGPRVGYLVSRYPAISHTFILREVLELRKLGFCIETASINLPDRNWSELPPVEQLETKSTVYIKEQGLLRALSALLNLLSRRPRSFFR